jgi:hypothetical protein
VDHHRISQRVDVANVIADKGYQSTAKQHLGAYYPEEELSSHDEEMIRQALKAIEVPADPRSSSVR